MTNYYIRKIVTQFDFDFNHGGSYGYSTNNILEGYDEVALGAASTYACRTKPNSVLNTTAQDLFIIYDNDRQYPPGIAAFDAGDITKVSPTDGYVYWSNYGIRGASYSGYSAYGWEVSQGWSSPNSAYTAFVGELCSKFNTFRAGTELSHENNWNLYVFQYQYADSPTEGASNLDWAYFPIFTKGNDPNYNSTITI